MSGLVRLIKIITLLFLMMMVTSCSDDAHQRAVDAGVKIFCPEDGIWPSTPADNTAKQSCGQGYSGEKTRYCDANGKWQNVNESQCKVITEPKNCSANWYPYKSSYVYFGAANNGGQVTGTCPENYEATSPIYGTCNDGNYQITGGECKEKIKSCSSSVYDSLSGTTFHFSMSVGASQIQTCPTPYYGYYQATCKQDSDGSVYLETVGTTCGLNKALGEINYINTPYLGQNTNIAIIGTGSQNGGTEHQDALDDIVPLANITHIKSDSGMNSGFLSALEQARSNKIIMLNKSNPKIGPDVSENHNKIMSEISTNNNSLYIAGIDNSKKYYYPALYAGKNYTLNGNTGTVNNMLLVGGYNDANGSKLYDGTTVGCHNSDDRDNISGNGYVRRTYDKNSCIYAPTYKSDATKNSSGGYHQDGVKDDIGIAMAYVAGTAAVISEKWNYLKGDVIKQIILDRADQTTLSDGSIIKLLNFDNALKADTTLYTNSSKKQAISGSITTSTAFGDGLSDNTKNLLSKANGFDKYGRNYALDLSKSVSEGNINNDDKQEVKNLIISQPNSTNQIQSVPISLPSFKGLILGFNLNGSSKALVDSSFNNEMGLENRESRYYISDDVATGNQELNDVNGIYLNATIDKKTDLKLGLDNMSARATNSFVDSINLIETSSLANPYLQFTSHNGSSMGIIRKLSGNLTGSISYDSNKLTLSSNNNNNYDYTNGYNESYSSNQEISNLLGNLEYKKDNNIISLYFGSANEGESLLGMSGDGVMSIADNSKTNFYGISFTKEIPSFGLSFMANYVEGYSSAKNSEYSYFSNIDNIKSNSYAFGITKSFGNNNKFGLVYSRPIAVIDGDATLTVATGVDNNGNALYESEKISLKSLHREQNFELFVSHYIKEGTNLLLNYLHRDNPNNSNQNANENIVTIRLKSEF